MKSLLPCSAEMEKDVNGIDERKITLVILKCSNVILVQVVLILCTCHAALNIVQQCVAEFVLSNFLLINHGYHIEGDS